MVSKGEINCEFFGKVILIKEVRLRPYSAVDLRDMLKEFVAQYSKYTILFPLFHKGDKEYSVNMKVLSRVGFKRLGYKPVYGKKLVRRRNKFRLTFKNLKEVGSEKPFKKLFVKIFSKSRHLGDFLDTLDTGAAFEDYVMNKKKMEWNFLAYESRKLVGMITLHKGSMMKGKYGTFGSIVVDSKYRGKGYALEMMRKAEEEFLKVGFKEYRGITDSKNLGMRKTFKKFGCKVLRKNWMYVYNPEVGLKRYL